MSKKTNYSKEDRIRLKKIIKDLDKDIKRLKVRRKNYKEQLTLTDVVASVLCVSDEIDCLNITKGEKYTLIESDNVFFRVVNDLGNEQLY